MLQNERYSLIYNILQEKGNVSTQYLQKRLFASEATIRRDLEAMEKQGLLKRVWGGAMLHTTADKDPPTFVRVKANNDKKARIAAIASKLIRESSSIFLDGSTTTMHLVPYFAKFKQLIFITNGLQIQQMLMEQADSNIYLIGGQVFEKRLTVGHMAISAVKQLHTDIQFFSCSGISVESGITGIEAKSCEVCAEMMKHTSTRVLLCDSTKAGSSYLWHLADFQDVDYIIMDAVPEDPALVEAMGNKLITDARQLKRTGG